MISSSFLIYFGEEILSRIPPLNASTFGVKDDVFRLFVSQLICYLLGIVFNVLLARQSVTVKHLSNVTFGGLIVYYNFGNHIAHSLASCVAAWSVMKILGPTRSMVAVNFIFAMGYLLWGYIDRGVTAHFTWTLPQCVLTLSLIAISFDYYDGRQNQISGSESSSSKASSSPPPLVINEDTAIDRLPTILEMLSKMYFPPTLLIGPQVRFRDFLQFMHGNDNLLPHCWKYSLSRFALGMTYFGAFQLGNHYFAADYFFSDDFKSHGLLGKMTLLALANKSTLCKYLSGWLISEGGCIMYGISRNPITGQMDRVFNVSILHFETATTFGGRIESFNMSTNAFALRYIFKRLRWLHSKIASQCITLLFLAVWHGFALGYYNTFAMELAMMKMEKDISALVIKWRTRNQRLNHLLNMGSVRAAIYVTLRIKMFYMFGYALISFFFLELGQWTSIYAQVHYIAHIEYFGWFVIALLIGL